MISRKLIAALVGLTLIGGTVAEASAATGPVAAKSAITKSAVTKSVSAPASKTVAKAPAGKIALKGHRLHVTHRAIKRAKVAKVSGSKRLALSHAGKRIAPKHV